MPLIGTASYQPVRQVLGHNYWGWLAFGRGRGGAGAGGAVKLRLAVAWPEDG